MANELGSKDMNMGSLGDKDEPYTFGRPRKYMDAMLNTFQIARLVVLRGKIQDRRIAAHLPTVDPDGLGGK